MEHERIVEYELAKMNESLQVIAKTLEKISERLDHM